MKGWFDDKLQPRRGRLKGATKTDYDSARAAWDALTAFGGEGWVSTTDQASRWPKEGLTDYAPLAAELAKGAGESLHLRYLGSVWRCWQLEDELLSPGEPEDGQDLALDESFASTEGRARLRYRTWWRLNGQEGGIRVWQPYASRFLGWED